MIAKAQMTLCEGTIDERLRNEVSNQWQNMPGVSMLRREMLRGRRHEVVRWCQIRKMERQAKAGLAPPLFQFIPLILLPPVANQFQALAFSFSRLVCHSARSFSRPFTTAEYSWPAGLAARQQG